MIEDSAIRNLVGGYSNPRVGVLGSHSALEIMDGAKDEGLSTVVFCQKGRELPYQRFSRIADEIIVVDKFNDMASDKKPKNADRIQHHSRPAPLTYRLPGIQDHRG